MNAPDKPFHGWYIVASCFVISLLLGGFVRMLPGIWSFFIAIVDEAEQSRSGFTLALTAGILSSLLAMLAVGWLVDKVGCKKPMLVGCLLSGAGMILFAGVSHARYYALLSFLVMAGTTATVSIPVYALLLNWFRRNRGLAIALASMGTAIGASITKFAGSFLVENFASRKSAVLIGAASLAVTIPLILRFIKDRPSEMRLHPDGIEPDENEPAEPTGHTLKKAFHTPTFWYIAVALSAMNEIPMIALPSLGASVKGGLSSWITGNFLASFVFLCIPLVGALADRRGARRTFVLIACVTAVSIGILAPIPAGWKLAFFPALMKICASSALVLAPLIIADCHGLSRFGIIFALLTLISGLIQMPWSLIIQAIPAYLMDRGFDPTIVSLFFFAPQIILLLLGAYLMSKTSPLTAAPPAPTESN